MPEFRIPNSASLHAARSFLRSNDFFGKPERKAILKLHPKWMHLEPYALAMAASWGVACRREGLKIAIRNMGPRAKYAARMKLFDHLGVEHGFEITEHEESGRFLPVRNVRNPADIQSVIADISAMLHLQARPDALAAVQYCISELLRNAIEHSGSPDGAFVCAHNYDQGQNRRVSVAVADCGSGIPAHLGRSYPEANADALVALHLAMLPGITGVIPGMYGTPDNAGAGLLSLGKSRGVLEGTSLSLLGTLCTACEEATESTESYFR